MTNNQNVKTDHHFLLIVGLISISLVASELIWTRIFSAELFYTFAFLTLSIAVLGLGLGALSIRLFHFLHKPVVLPLMLIISAVFAVIGPVFVIALGLKFSQILFTASMFGKFLIAIFILGIPYFCAGIVLAALFRSQYQQMHKLYMSDLLGAGFGVLLAIITMNTLGTPAAVFLLPLPTLLAANLLLSAKMRFITISLCIAIIAATPWADNLLEAEHKNRATVIYKHWDAMSKIKVFDYGPEARGISIDNVANTPIIGFDGNWKDFENDPDHWDINVGNLIQRFDNPTFLSLGAGGGMDVLQALSYGADEIHAVEVNPHINKMLQDGDAAGYLAIDDEQGRPRTFTTSNVFSGQIYNDPRVNVISEDARTYVRRFENKFDIIYSLSSNTFAALGSGSFAFAENYLFTVEAFMDYWNALSEDGFLVMEHQFYMPRLVTDVLIALSRLGIDKPESHISVYKLPKMKRHILLLSKTALTNEIRQTALGQLNGEGRATKHLVYPLITGKEDNLINQIVTSGWKKMSATAEIDVSPTYDDRPFIAQMGLWKNFDFDKLNSIHPVGDVMGFPLSKAILVLIIAVILIIIVPLNLLPFFRQDDKLSLNSWGYFFCIGLAFMIIEIVLIQKYTLIIGASIYSIATVLITLLIASGIGSRYAKHFGDTIPFVAILIWMMLHLAFDSSLLELAKNIDMPMRATLVSLCTFPLGFFMGMPFVKGSLRVGELVDWGFAVNGAASIFGATIAIILAFNVGYIATLMVATVLYVFAGILLLQPKGW